MGTELSAEPIAIDMRGQVVRIGDSVCFRAGTYRVVSIGGDRLFTDESESCLKLEPLDHAARLTHEDRFREPWRWDGQSEHIRVLPDEVLLAPATVTA